MRTRWDKNASDWAANQYGYDFWGHGETHREAVADLLAQGAHFAPPHKHHEVRWEIPQDVWENLLQQEGWEEEDEVLISHYDDPSLSYLDRGISFQERIYVTTPATYAYQLRIFTGDQHVQRDILPPLEDGSVVIFDHEGKEITLMEVGDFRVKRSSYSWQESTISMENIRIRKGGGSHLYCISISQDHALPSNIWEMLEGVFPSLEGVVPRKLPSLCHVLK